MIDLVVQHFKYGQFNAFIDERLVTTSKTPLIDAARVLLAEGVPASEAITMRHTNSGTISFSTTVGRAADLEVIERARGGAPTLGTRRRIPLTAADAERLRKLIAERRISRIANAEHQTKRDRQAA